MPVKVTTAPISLRPRVSAAASAAASNGSCCRRTVMLLARNRRVGKGGGTACLRGNSSRAPCPRVLAREITWARRTRALFTRKGRATAFAHPTRVHHSSSRHRRKERDLARACDRGVGAHVGAINRSTYHARILERMGIALAAPGKPGNQLADGCDRRRRHDLLLGLADPLAHPRKIQNLQALFLDHLIR